MSIRKNILKVVIALLGLSAIALMTYEMAHWFAHVYSGEARVRTDLTKIAAQVEGTLDRILVKEGDQVKAGQLLVSLVDKDIQLSVESAKADLALELAERARLISEKKAFELEQQSKLVTRQKQIESSEIEYRATLDRLGLAKADLERVKVLVAKSLASKKAMATEQDKVLIQQGEASRLLAKIQIAKSELEQVRATLKQLDVIEDRIKVSDITSKKLQTTIDKEGVALSFRHLRSPVNGVIDRVYKHKGEYVEEGEAILVLHDESLFWIEAFVEEDQIRHVKVGQSVVIHLPAYPFDEFFGEVSQIGSATTAELGLDENTTRRAGRPTQRVPISVLINNPPTNIAPGMLAKVNVRLHEDFRPRSLFHILKIPFLPDE